MMRWSVPTEIQLRLLKKAMAWLTLTTFLQIENFEEREQERGYLDLEVLRFMRSKR
jgi:putative peptidoglycan binding protein